jgi:hypothetical protein
MLAVSQDENIPAAAVPFTPLDGPGLLEARDICGGIRQALAGVLITVTNGARDLRKGQPWSQNLEQFELVSMEQARLLANFPIGTTDERFGALVHRARASFVAFRETVRREIISSVDGGTGEAACQQALNRVVIRWALAEESLKSVEQALTQHWLQASAVQPDNGPGW